MPNAPTATNPRTGGHYTAKQDADGTWSIFNVPIFAELPEGERRNKAAIGAKWMREAVQMAKVRQSEGYEAPLHIYHHDGAHQTRPAGRVILREVKQVMYEGEPTYTVFADFTKVPADVFELIESEQLPYRSVEVHDWDKPEIASVALLDDEVPFFKLAMLTIGLRIPWEPAATAFRATTKVKSQFRGYVPAKNRQGALILFRMEEKPKREGEGDQPDDTKLGQHFEGANCAGCGSNMVCAACNAGSQRPAYRSKNFSKVVALFAELFPKKTKKEASGVEDKDEHKTDDEGHENPTRGENEPPKEGKDPKKPGAEMGDKPSCPKCGSPMSCPTCDGGDVQAAEQQAAEEGMLMNILRLLSEIQNTNNHIAQRLGLDLTKDVEPPKQEDRKPVEQKLKEETMPPTPTPGPITATEVVIGGQKLTEDGIKLLAESAAEVASLKKKDADREAKEKLNALITDAFDQLKSWPLTDKIRADIKAVAADAGEKGLKTFVEAFKNAVPKDPPSTLEQATSGTVSNDDPVMAKFAALSPEKQVKAKQLARDYDTSLKGKITASKEAFIRANLGV